MLTKAIAVAGVLLMAAGPANAATILTNGGFEDPTIGGPCCNTVVAPGSFTDWSVLTGDVNVVSGTFNSSAGNLAFEGKQYLDLIGQSGGGSISQTFNSVVGQVYNLTFAYSHNIFGGLPSAGASFSVGALSGSVTHSTGNTSNLDWRLYNGTFVGTGSPMVLSFVNTSGDSNAGTLLDAVSISAAPEPASWLMMIGGFGLAGVAMRRRRKDAFAVA